LNISLYNV